MDSITYKCPNCGGGLVFEPETQKFKCGYCLSVFTEEELKKMTPDSQSASE
ncbi:MAG: TFIIB-type zinc ribbon-containing protein, partial [Clostridium sp.]